MVSVAKTEWSSTSCNCSLEHGCGLDDTFHGSHLQLFAFCCIEVSKALRALMVQSSDTEWRDLQVRTIFRGLMPASPYSNFGLEHGYGLVIQRAGAEKKDSGLQDFGTRSEEV